MTDADKLTQHHQDYQFAVTKALSQAIRVLDRADRHASVFADIVRQQVEHRLDAAFTSGDPGVVRDSQYQAALIAYHRIHGTHLAVRDALARWAEQS